MSRGFDAPKGSSHGFDTCSLAIARIFGGIPQSFFKTYHEYLPKSEPEDQYELRGDLYELYHYLNHTVLFGVCSNIHDHRDDIKC